MRWVGVLFVGLSFVLVPGAVFGQPGDGLQAPETRHAVALGPLAVDPEGQEGRIHHVVAGDTLWDISQAYLGTAWVWPSVWQDNGSIENPHRIRPGDRIWIGRNRMRLVTEAEAREWTLRKQRENESAQRAEAKEASSSAYDKTASSVPAPRFDRMGLISERALSAASSIVDSSEMRTWLAEGDRVYVGLGQAEVEAGDRFTIFREPEPVRDLETHKRIGYHVNVVGWLEILEVGSSSSVARIGESISEIARGDRITPRRNLPKRISFREGPDREVEGRIVFTPGKRTVMGTRDTVYVNRGSDHGLAPGVRLQAFDRGRAARDLVRNQSVKTPEHVVADLVVVLTQQESAVVRVTHTTRELEVGDSFRTRTDDARFAGL